MGKRSGSKDASNLSIMRVNGLHSCGLLGTTVQLSSAHALLCGSTTS